MVERRAITDYEPLTKEMVEEHQVWEVAKPYPKEVTTKYRQDQLCVNVKREGTEPKTWFVNPTSVNALIDKYGNDEKKWVGKRVVLKVKPIEINGEEQRAIFLASD